MKYLFILSFFSLLSSPFAFAENEDKFSTLKKWFEAGDSVSYDEVSDIQDAIYVGRCYSAQKPDQAKASLLGFVPLPNHDGPAFPAKSTEPEKEQPEEKEEEKYHFYPAIHPYKKASFYDFWDKGLALLTLNLSLSETLSQFNLKRGNYLETLAVQFIPKAKGEDSSGQSQSVIVPIRRYEDDLVALFVTKKQADSSSEHKVHYSCYYFKTL